MIPDMKRIGLIAFWTAWILAVMAIAVYAAPTPKSVPSPSGNLCFNLRTGAIRDALIINGVPQACHRNEFPASILNLSSAPTPDPAPTKGGPAPTPSPGAPTPSPSPGDPTPTPAPSSTPTVQGSTCTNCVVDANGTEVGQLNETGSDPGFDQQVILNIQGVDLSIPVTEDGFVNFQSSGIDTVERFPTNDCSGQGYIAVATGANVKPLVESWAVQMGPYVYGTTVYFAQPPFVNITVLSVREFTNASQQGQCEPALQGTDLGTYTAGIPASADLNAFGFVTPFDFK